MGETRPSSLTFEVIFIGRCACEINSNCHALHGYSGGIERSHNVPVEHPEEIKDDCTLTNRLLSVRR